MVTWGQYAKQPFPTRFQIRHTVETIIAQPLQKRFIKLRISVLPYGNAFPETIPWQNAIKLADDDLAVLYAYLTAPVQ